MYLTRGIADLPDADCNAICEKVETFNSFALDNDPHGEHDFGAFEHAGHKIFWNFDYYDRASFGTGRDMGSEDPTRRPMSDIFILLPTLGDCLAPVGRQRHGGWLRHEAPVLNSFVDRFN